LQLEAGIVKLSTVLLLVWVLGYWPGTVCQAQLLSPDSRATGAEISAESTESSLKPYTNDELVSQIFKTEVAAEKRPGLAGRMFGWVKHLVPGGKDGEPEAPSAPSYNTSLRGSDRELKEAMRLPAQEPPRPDNSPGVVTRTRNFLFRHDNSASLRMPDAPSKSHVADGADRQASSQSVRDYATANSHPADRPADQSAVVPRPHWQLDDGIRH
jgi:hypothetical protein